MKKTPFHDDSFRQSDLFNGLADSERTAILNQGDRIRSRPGEILFSQGDPARRCYLVLKGRLRLTALHEQGKQAVIRYIGPGQLTAAVAVFKEKDYPVTAETIGTAELLAWDRQVIVKLMLAHPQLAVNTLKVVIDRLDDVQTRYLQISAEQVKQRIARALLRIMRHSGRKTDEGILIDFPISRQELGPITRAPRFAR
jgi:CRP/FNR family transcriptional regulator, nitrogen oxide reductase regulator